MKRGIPEINTIFNLRVPIFRMTRCGASGVLQATVLRSLLKQIGMAEDELKTIFEDPDDPRKRTVITWILANSKDALLFFLVDTEKDKGIGTWMYPPWMILRGKKKGSLIIHIGGNTWLSPGCH
jgi:hypothetical protein